MEGPFEDGTKLAVLVVVERIVCLLDSFKGGMGGIVLLRPRRNSGLLMSVHFLLPVVHKSFEIDSVIDAVGCNLGHSYKSSWNAIVFSVIGIVAGGMSKFEKFRYAHRGLSRTPCPDLKFEVC